MYHFYSENASIADGRITLSGPDVNHIKNVLRMRVGEQLIVCDGEGTDHYCSIEDFGEGNVIVSVHESSANQSELGTSLILFQGLPKKDKMELIIEKAVELGVSQIVPVMTKRVIVKIEDSKKEEKKLQRWNAIALSAAKQSGRGIIPKVTDIMSFKEALGLAATLEKNFIPYENSGDIGVDMKTSREMIKGLKGTKSIGIFIGPEGGFERSEVLEALDAGCSCLSLGNRILRTETAGLTALSVIMFELDD